MKNFTKIIIGVIIGIVVGLSVQYFELLPLFGGYQEKVVNLENKFVDLDNDIDTKLDKFSTKIDTICAKQLNADAIQKQTILNQIALKKDVKQYKENNERMEKITQELNKQLVQLNIDGAITRTKLEVLAQGQRRIESKLDREIESERN